MKRILAILLAVVTVFGAFGAVAASAATAYAKPADGFSLVQNSAQTSMTKATYYYQVPTAELTDWQDNYKGAGYTWTVKKANGTALAASDGNLNGISVPAVGDSGLYSITIDATKASVDIYGTLTIQLTINYTQGAVTSALKSITLTKTNDLSE